MKRESCQTIIMNFSSATQMNQIRFDRYRSFRVYLCLATLCAVLCRNNIVPLSDYHYPVACSIYLLFIRLNHVLIIHFERNIANCLRCTTLLNDLSRLRMCKFSQSCIAMIHISSIVLLYIVSSLLSNHYYLPLSLGIILGIIIIIVTICIGFK